MGVSPQSIHILHVDDEPGLAELAAEFLKRENDRITVDIATNASDGLDLLGENGYDCVVSDYDMPEQNGIEFLKSVREDKADLPFILYTGKGSEEVASEAVAAGVTDYLQKRPGSEQYELLANRIANAVEQFESSQRATNLERLRRVIKDANQALVATDTRDEIERHICDIITDADPYRFAWIGERDPDTHTIIPSTASGVEDGYLDGIEISTEAGPTGQGPSGKAARNREITVVQNIAENREFEPWRAAALERGYQASAAIPLIKSDTLYGILNVYADRIGVFDAEEQELLEELALNTAAALQRNESRERLRTYERLVETLPVGIYRATAEPDSKVIDANPALADMVGADSPKHIEGRSVSSFDLYSTESDAVRDQLQREGSVEGKELRRENHGGEDIWVSITAILTEEDDDRYIDGVVQDITEQKARERDLWLFREAVEATGHSIYFTDSQGTIEYVNPAFEEITGYTAEEATGLNPHILKSGEHEDAFYAELWETITAGDIWRDDLINSTRSGERYVVNQTIAPVEGRGGDIEYFVAVNAEVSERVEHEQKVTGDAS